jgi:hypothetical protein
MTIHPPAVPIHHPFWRRTPLAELTGKTPWVNTNLPALYLPIRTPEQGIRLAEVVDLSHKPTQEMLMHEMQHLLQTRYASLIVLQRSLVYSILHILSHLSRLNIVISLPSCDVQIPDRDDKSDMAAKDISKELRSHWRLLLQHLNPYTHHIDEACTTATTVLHYQTSDLSPNLKRKVVEAIEHETTPSVWEICQLIMNQSWYKEAQTRGEDGLNRAALVIVFLARSILHQPPHVIRELYYDSRIEAVSSPYSSLKQALIHHSRHDRLETAFSDAVSHLVTQPCIIDRSWTDLMYNAKDMLMFLIGSEKPWQNKRKLNPLLDMYLALLSVGRGMPLLLSDPVIYVSNSMMSYCPVTDLKEFYRLAADSGLVKLAVDLDQVFGGTDSKEKMEEEQLAMHFPLISDDNEIAVCERHVSWIAPRSQWEIAISEPAEALAGLESGDFDVGLELRIGGPLPGWQFVWTLEQVLEQIVESISQCGEPRLRCMCDGSCQNGIECVCIAIVEPIRRQLRNDRGEELPAIQCVRRE